MNNVLIVGFATLLLGLSNLTIYTMGHEAFLYFIRLAHIPPILDVERTIDLWMSVVSRNNKLMRNQLLTFMLRLTIA